MKTTLGPIRLYAGKDDDLITKVASIRPAEYGVMTREIKAALRRGWGLTEEAEAPVNTVLLERLDALPGQMRAILDAALAGVVIGQSNGDNAGSEDSEFLNSLNAFMLEEDDE